MKNPLEHLQNWKGDIFQLEQTAVDVLRALGRGTIPAPNIRLIRDYAQRGILSPTERDGKLAQYSFQHLKELVAARILVNDGVPLSKIAEQFELDRDIVLVALALPSSGKPPASAARARWAGLGAAPTASSVAASESVGSAFMRRAVEGTGRRVALQQALQRLGAAVQDVKPQQITQVPITDWCSLLIDSARLQALSAEEADDLGRAVAALLSDARLKKREKP
jgi:DNA-binding transcriptional MerR regulator